MPDIPLHYIHFQDLTNHMVLLGYVVPLALEEDFTLCVHVQAGLRDTDDVIRAIKHAISSN